MLIARGNREDAIRALINTWLKDPEMYCAHCDKKYDFNSLIKEPCCERPLINRNTENLKLFLKEVNAIKETRSNDYASNDQKTMRWGLSMPSRLYQFLDKAFRRLYNEKLISKEHSMTWFAKKFPQFAVPKTL